VHNAAGISDRMKRPFTQNVENKVQYFLQKRRDAMDLSTVIVPVFTHLLPIMFFAYMGLDVWLRNPKKVEHRLVGITSLCFLLLFLEEYIRHQLPIAYSPILAGIWFSSVGVAIPGLGFHLFVKLTQLDRRMPRFLYPGIFYLPLTVVAINLVTGDSIISVHAFTENGMWKTPVYNGPYYITMVASIINNLLYLIPLAIGERHAATPELRLIYRHLARGVVISACWFAVFGLIDFGSILPPYPYLYGGVVWCFFLRQTMMKYDFLNFVSKRYETLFNMNPAAILLLDEQGNIKEANPVARQWMQENNLDASVFQPILREEVREKIRHEEPLKQLELTMDQGDKRLEVLIDADDVLVDAQPHLILIVTDVTMQKESQREISFLAFHDPLTRMPNRASFYQSLTASLQQAESGGRQVAVILIDLDNFKQINDEFGHLVGDRVLVHAAGLLGEAVDRDGVAARWGGDEFVCYLDPVESVEAVQAWVESLKRKVREHPCPHAVAGTEIPIEMSIGISYFPEDGKDSDTLLNHADRLMYEQKRNRSVRIN
jgi:diguanylate cyclase (GGDEF)-like protein